MAALEAATQCARVCGRLRIIGSQTLARWMAGSEAGHGESLIPPNPKRLQSAAKAGAAP